MKIRESIAAVVAGLGSKGLGIKHGTPLMVANSDNGTMEEMEKVTTDIAEVLKKEIAFYKDEALPAMKLYKESVTREYDARSAAYSGRMPGIVNLSIPEFIYMAHERNPFSTKPFEIPKRGLVIPEWNDGAFAMYFGPGRDAMQSSRQSFINTISPDRVKYVWETYIMNISSDNGDLNTLFNITNYSNINKNDIYIAKILVHHMTDNIPDGTIGTLDEYRNKLAVFEIAIDNAIFDIIRLMARAEATKTVVLRIKKKEDILDMNVVVSDPMYMHYINNGGSSDALLGASLKRNGSITISELSENEDNFIKSYRSTIASRNTINDTINSDMLKKVYITTFNNMFVDITPQSHVDDNDITGAVIDLINETNLNELQEYSEVVNNIFSKVVYSNSNVGYFTMKIREYNENGVPIDVALTNSIQDLLVEYVCGMIEVTE